MYHPRLKGSHYEAGLKFGQMMKKNNVNPLKFMKQPKEQYLFGIECIKETEKYYPEVLEEMYGLADGLEEDRNSIAAWLLCIYCYTKENWCTTIIMKDENELLFARNSDFAIVVEKLIESAYYHLDECYSFIGNSTAMIQMEDGVNEHGLAIGLNFILPTIIKPGLNAGFLVRYILEKCKTVEEGIQALQQLPISSAQIITMVDANGNMASVECNSIDLEIRRANEKEPFLVASNNFVTEKMKQYKVNVPDTIHSKERYDVAMKSLKENKYSVEYAKDLLAGKYGFMCQYNRKYGMDTVWSAIYDLKQKKNYIAPGNPSRIKFKEDTRL